MSNEKVVQVRNGVGFFGLLAIAFIVLKLINVITWSWLWILGPIWVSIAIFVLVIICIILYHLIKD